MSRVLIVEDEPMIGRILEHKLRREGHDVVLTTSASDADRALLAASVDVALVDATLERDGIEWARLAGASSARCGWLAMVEARRAGAGERAIDAGASGVVVKPFKPTAVAEQVRRLLDAGGAT